MIKRFSAVLKDGTRGWVLPFKEVPKSFWAKHDGAWSMGFDETNVKDPRNLPQNLVQGRQAGLVKEDNYPTSPYIRYLVWIADCDLEPEHNEWGEVAP